VELGGQLLGFARNPETGGAEAAGVIAAAFILVLGFGTVVAAGLPIGLAVGGLTGGLSLVRLLAALFDVSSVGLMLGTMIGLGVGIDYALFIVTRYRRFLSEGLEVPEAVGRASGTAGKAVVFAGATVIISIAGLAVAGIPAVTLMGASAAIVVAVMVLGSVTMLPALLSVAGRRINRLSVRRRAGESPGEQMGSVWGRWGRQVERRPKTSLVAGLLVLAVLAAPVVSLDLAMPDGSMEPQGDTRREAYGLLERSFGPGFNGPLLLAIDLPPEDGSGAARLSVMSLRAEVAETPGVAQVSPPQMSPQQEAAVLQVTPRTGPQAQATEDLVHELRDRVIPNALAGTGVQAYVGGQSAILIDFTERTLERLPWFFLTVIGLSFLLLTVLFRSVVIPLTAAIMNLFSIGAAYGVVVAVFQWGWGAGLIGVDQTTPIITFLPMLMFAILFGLSMDYEVFLLSEVQENYRSGYSNAESVVRGISATGGVITSAAAIMIVVFTGFVLGDDIAIKQVGLGLAVAILVDATLVRVLLVPSTMVVIGDANWWMPGGLARFIGESGSSGNGDEGRRCRKGAWLG